MTSASIEISGLSKSYGAIAALDDVSLTIPPGELFGLIGPDGAGKTTLYSILTTLMKPDAGEARMCGLEVTADRRRLRPLIGYMPERFSLYPDLTVSENLHFFASLFGTTVDSSMQLIAPVFGQLARFPHRRAGALSGGMKQKLALCCALIHKPRVLLLDEPTTGVDAISRSEFWDLLRQLNSSGLTVMVSTSYMEEATLCSRIGLINRGRLLGVDSPEKLVSRLGESLYAARGPEMFRLLEALRRQPDVENCYTFGATLHLVGKEGFSPAEAIKRLSGEGLRDVSIKPTRGTIEDLFIKLTVNDTLSL